MRVEVKSPPQAWMARRPCSLPHRMTRPGPRCCRLDSPRTKGFAKLVGTYRDLVVIRLPLASSAGDLTSLHALVALGELPQVSERVGPELVEDAGDELGELLVGAVAVDGECVGAHGSVDGLAEKRHQPLRVPLTFEEREEADTPFGEEKWRTRLSSLNMFTSSIPLMGWTGSFLSAAWSFLSSPVPAAFGFLTTLRRG
jgi:hypothetical protein